MCIYSKGEWVYDGDPMRSPRVLLFISMALAAGALTPELIPGSGAQTQTAAPSQPFRVQVRLVPVDVIVTDSKDRPVTDLKREDFRIFENGQPQEISHFAIQMLVAAPEAAPAAQPQPPGEFAPQTVRTFLIVMGRGRFTIFKTLESMMQFVRKDLLPQDRVAFLAYNRATDFTTDHERVARVIERFKREHEWIEALEAQRMSGLRAIFGNKDWPKEIQKRIDKIFNEPGGIASRQVSPTQAADQKKMEKDAAQATGTLLVKEAIDQAAAAGDPGAALRQSIMQFDALSAASITDLPFSEYASSFAATMQSTRNIYTSIDYIRFIEGEKHLLFFTPSGLDLPRVEYDQQLSAYASDARVAIDVFQTGGCCPPSEWLASIRNIANLTGGRATIVDYAAKGLARINETTRLEYLLAYYPKNTTFDGKYRRIEVKVNRPGLKVSFRHGYYAREKPPALNVAEMLGYRRITSAGADTSELRDVSFDAYVSLDPLPITQVRVDMFVKPEDIGLAVVNGRHAGHLRVTIYYADGAGRYLGEVWKNVDINLTEQNYRLYHLSGIPFTIMVPFRVKKQMLKIILYDPQRDRIGSQLIKMK
jgi:VWFA-related protein